MGPSALEMRQIATRIRLPTAGRRDRRRGNRITQSPNDIESLRVRSLRRSAAFRVERQDLGERYSVRKGSLVPLVI